MHQIKECSNICDCGNINRNLMWNDLLDVLLDGGTSELGRTNDDDRIRGRMCLFRRKTATIVIAA